MKNIISNKVSNKIAIKWILLVVLLMVMAISSDIKAKPVYLKSVHAVSVITGVEIKTPD